MPDSDTVGLVFYASDAYASWKDSSDFNYRIIMSLVKTGTEVCLVSESGNSAGTTTGIQICKGLWFVDNFDNGISVFTDSGICTGYF